MKKLMLSSAVVSLLSFNAAAADVITFDPAGDGSTEIQLDSLNVSIQGGANSPYEVQQYFHGGDDDTLLDDGDIFTESFVYDSVVASLDGNAANWNPMLLGLGLGNLIDVTFEFELSGHIEDVVYGDGTGDAPDITDPATFGDRFAATSFNTVFDAVENGLTIKYEGNVIGQFDVLSGVSTDPVQLGGTANTGFIFEFDFNQDWVAANSNESGTGLFQQVWQDENGNPFGPDTAPFGSSDPFQLSIATGSAGPTGNPFATQQVPNGQGGFVDSPLFVQNDGGDNDGRTYFSVEVVDNGALITYAVPEPTTVAILGLGLLGLARIRRQA